MAQKQSPVQRRSVDTLNLILNAAATLLGEVGIERLSTNLICKRAGLTPPALYRYFPNKYAVLKELGSRLMERQNNAYLEWLKTARPSPAAGSKAENIESLRHMQELTNAVTCEFPGAVWIMRAMRAVPALQQVRFDSHNFVAQRAFEDVRQYYPRTSDAELRLATRLAVEMLYAATEMVFDEPGLDASKINIEMAEMVARYFEKFAEREVESSASGPA